MATSISTMSNMALLSLLVGPTAARALARRPLTEIFGYRMSRNRDLLSEEAADYVVNPALAAAKELISRCMRERMEEEDCISSPEIVKAFLCTKMAHLEYEAFWCLWLDSQNRLIDAGEIFRGTINQALVHPREVVKKALAVNAAGVIFAHNHPSGVAEPSQADKALTERLKAALALVEVRVLDHFVVGGNKATSFAAMGLI